MSHLTQQLATQIHAKRVERGLSYRQLGTLCGVSYSTLRRIEKQEQSPTIEVLDKICTELEIDWQQLLSRT